MQHNQEFKGLELEHLSPSTVNSFIENKYGFIQSKVMGKPWKGNPNTIRGNAVEHAVNEKFKGSKALPAQLAIAKYDELIARDRVTDKPDIRATINDIAERAWMHYREISKGEVPTLQKKLNFKFKSLNRQVVGYLDFLYNSKIRDCKVVGRTPSSLKQSYKIQGAVYQKVFKLPVVFDFFIPLAKDIKVVSIPLSEEDYKFGLHYFLTAAKCIEKLIDTIDPVEVMHLMSFPNLEGIWDEYERNEAAEAYDLKVI